jgi:hypothetical protein
MTSRDPLSSGASDDIKRWLPKRTSRRAGIFEGNTFFDPPPPVKG